MSNQLSNDEFVALTSPSNHGAKLLLIHVYLCEHVLSQAYLTPLFPCYNLRRGIIYEWLRRVVNSVPEELKSYAGWANRFVREKVYTPPPPSTSQERDAATLGVAGAAEGSSASMMGPSGKAVFEEVQSASKECVGGIASPEMEVTDVASSVGSPEMDLSGLGPQMSEVGEEYGGLGGLLMGDGSARFFWGALR